MKHDIWKLISLTLKNENKINSTPDKNNINMKPKKTHKKNTATSR